MEILLTGFLFGLFLWLLGKALEYDENFARKKRERKNRR